ncbi:MAG TPA: DEAD/DEAH box helicase [Acidimicrobiales bacterium]
MTDFHRLGVPRPLVDALARAGITRPFPIQSLTLPDALAGRDVTGKARTGSGKTLAFGLPTLARVPRAAPRHPRALVLAPTRELAVQIADELAPLAAAVDRSVTAIYGGAPLDRQSARLAAGTDVVVATPGRLIDLVQRGDAHLDAVAITTVDEADRMADMGFLPQVEWLLRHVPTGGQTMLFSATLDGAVAALTRRMVDPAVHSVEHADATVDSMTHRFIKVHHMDKPRVIAALGATSSRILVFCRTKRNCDRLTRDLAALGVGAAAIHGDLPQSQRQQALDRFAAGHRPVLVATDVAARGIHVDDIDIVVHSDPPQDHKAYLHRSGRTARAGATGLAVALIEWDQELAVRRLQSRLGLAHIPQVEMFSNDPRLDNLAAWNPAEVA